jgi:Zn-dependent protease
LLLFARTPDEIISVLIALTVGMTVHEFAHSYVAHLMGDPTPQRLGRLTLNPLVHINWFGWLMFVLVGFGILGSAPIQPHLMRNPRWGFFASILAGPVSNLFIAIVAGIIFRLLTPMMLAGTLPDIIQTILYFMVFYNVLLFMFNLLPFFPIDGWHIVYALLPPEQARVWGSAQWRQYSQFALFGLILLSFTGINLLGRLISGPSSAITFTLLGLA